ncbi:uncharacterized protein LOC129743656 [Uranotaenia lowii]|uniref:uncharacterized protein LOC129743656 n=1 Tax=Uranotaenia lowii TaxID=190385 RepID=UPI00247883D2|nr:uncharacterized protein LOC129743656 [Uranotaenia lowii]
MVSRFLQLTYEIKVVKIPVVTRQIDQKEKGKTRMKNPNEKENPTAGLHGEQQRHRLRALPADENEDLFDGDPVLSKLCNQVIREPTTGFGRNHPGAGKDGLDGDVPEPWLRRRSPAKTPCKIEKKCLGECVSA